MFWKKKEAQAIPVVEPIAKYSCVAPNYLEVVTDNEGESLDAVKEAIYEKLKPKVLTREEIDTITEKFEFDTWKGMVWCDVKYLNKELSHKNEITVLYRLDDFKDDVPTDEVDEIKKRLNFVDFYNMVNIQATAAEVGFDVYDRCIWKAYTQITYTVPSLNFTMVQYHPNSSQ